MKYFLFFLTIAGALLAGRLLAAGRIGLVSGFLPGFAAIAWFWSFSLAPRLGLAVATGFFMDAVSLSPIGTFLFPLGILAAAFEWYRRVFLAHEEWANRLAAFGIFAGTFAGMIWIIQIAERI